MAGNVAEPTMPTGEFVSAQADLDDALWREVWKGRMTLNEARARMGLPPFRFVDEADWRIVIS